MKIRLLFLLGFCLLSSVILQAQAAEISEIENKAAEILSIVDSQFELSDEEATVLFEQIRDSLEDSGEGSSENLGNGDSCPVCGSKAGGRFQGFTGEQPKGY